MTHSPNRPFACLPMYDWPEVRADWDEFWKCVHERLRIEGIPARPSLIRSREPRSVWEDGDMLLGQTCGWPYLRYLRDKVTVIGRIDFGLGTKTAGDYFSVFVTGKATEASAADILLDHESRIAVNDLDSQSGFRSLATLVPKTLELKESRLVMTGTHRNSIIAVATGRADLAAIDAVSWRLALAHEPHAPDLRVAGRSPDSPGLPLVTAANHRGRKAALRTACADAVRDLDPAIRKRIGVRDIVDAHDGDYDVLARPPFHTIGMR